MNANRFEKLIETVESIPEDRFDMNYWWMPRTDCGAVGCAIGWYIEKHAEENLELELSGPYNQEFDTFECIALHFDIPVEVAGELFIAASYNNNWRDKTHIPKTIVLSRILKYYEANKPSPAQVEELQLA